MACSTCIGKVHFDLATLLSSQPAIPGETDARMSSHAGIVRGNWGGPTCDVLHEGGSGLRPPAGRAFGGGCVRSGPLAGPSGAVEGRQRVHPSSPLVPCSSCMASWPSLLHHQSASARENGLSTGWSTGEVPCTQVHVQVRGRVARKQNIWQLFISTEKRGFGWVLPLSPPGFSLKCEGVGRSGGHFRNQHP